MRAVGVLLALVAASSVSAEDSTSPLTFTYQTFTGASVGTTSTTYTATLSSNTNTATCSAHTTNPYHGGVPTTTYTLNSSVLAYPTFSSVPASIANGPAGHGLQNASQFSAEALQLIFLLKKASAANCETCQTTMHHVKQTMKVQQEFLSDISTPLCTALSEFLPLPICIGLFKIASTDLGGVFPAMDMRGQDGQTLCAFIFGLCTLPPVPKHDLNKLFKGTKKPNPKPLTPSKKEPLKVLHISDYHLDMRYVVGSEAACTSPVCCRVYPYTNTSTPIKEPASLFGNYLCDTPEPLATSVFRNVPKVTGHDWCDFAFGIFTGDLVSHDLWELTEEYVMAEELLSYQQFFDGMGGVTLYPTLGNHDTFPHAFTAFPNQDGVLPENASYPVQQLPNYAAVASAWANYGWLSASEAQQVITSGLGIYRTVTKEGLVIISLNSDAWYYFNLYAYIGANVADHTGIFAILIDYLLEAEARDQAVWLISHVPTGGSTDYEALPAPSDLYYQIITRFSHTIRATFTGHTHADEFALFYTHNGTHQTSSTAAAVTYIMPSVTPYTNLNAAFRYYLVDAATFQVLDSLTYYANVSDTAAWAADGDVQWEFEYSARETYDWKGTLAPDEPLSPAWWHGVVEDIEGNATTFQTYTDLRTKRFRPYAPVTGRARNLTLCGLRSMSVPLFEDCLGSMESTTSFL